MLCTPTRLVAQCRGSALLDVMLAACSFTAAAGPERRPPAGFRAGEYECLQRRDRQPQASTQCGESEGPRRQLALLWGTPCPCQGCCVHESVLVMTGRVEEHRLPTGCIYAGKRSAAGASAWSLQLRLVTYLFQLLLTRCTARVQGAGRRELQRAGRVGQAGVSCLRFC